MCVLRVLSAAPVSLTLRWTIRVDSRSWLLPLRCLGARLAGALARRPRLRVSTTTMLLVLALLQLLLLCPSECARLSRAELLSTEPDPVCCRGGGKRRCGQQRACR